MSNEVLSSPFIANWLLSWRTRVCTYVRSRGFSAVDIEVVGQADAVAANLQCIGIIPAALQIDPDGALRVAEEGLFEGVGD